ncbi:MAG: hypothetical protein EBY17_28630 [Acidobacteriia bacterium]|nr:hypothetical protein [Terriglobia bacterium]
MDGLILGLIVTARTDTDGNGFGLTGIEAILYVVAVGCKPFWVFPEIFLFRWLITAGPPTF